MPRKDTVMEPESNVPKVTESSDTSTPPVNVSNNGQAEGLQPHTMLGDPGVLLPSWNAVSPAVTPAPAPTTPIAADSDVQAIHTLVQTRLDQIQEGWLASDLTLWVYEKFLGP